MQQETNHLTVVPPAAAAQQDPAVGFGHKYILNKWNLEYVAARHYLHVGVASQVEG